MEKLRLAVLTGGPSPEYEVSLQSAGLILSHLDRDRYQIILFLLGKDLSWQVLDPAPSNFADLKSHDRSKKTPLGEAMETLASCQIAFPAMHGAFGEDGRIQGLLDCLGVPFVGSGVAASALAIDKIRTKQILESFGLPHAPYEVLHRDQKASVQEQISGLQSRLGERLVVKSPTKGSSLAVYMTDSPEGIQAAATEIFKDEDRALVESRMEGREVTCGVVDRLSGEPPEALSPTEILPPEGQTFDYEAKYTPGMTQEITPPDMPAAWIDEIQTRAIQVHRILGLSGLSRTDMIVSPDGHVTLLEVNTIPGMTETSLLPQAAACAGLNFPKLLDRLIEVTLVQETPSP